MRLRLESRGSSLRSAQVGSVDSFFPRRVDVIRYILAIIGLISVEGSAIPEGSNLYQKTSSQLEHVASEADLPPHILRRSHGTSVTPVKRDEIKDVTSQSRRWEAKVQPSNRCRRHGRETVAAYELISQCRVCGFVHLEPFTDGADLLSSRLNRCLCSRRKPTTGSLSSSLAI